MGESNEDTGQPANGDSEVKGDIVVGTVAVVASFFLLVAKVADRLFVLAFFFVAKDLLQRHFTEIERNMSKECEIDNFVVIGV